MFNLSAGTIASLSGVLVVILSWFHFIIDPQVLGQGITNIIDTVSFITMVWGILHNHSALNAANAKLAASVKP